MNFCLRYNVHVFKCYQFSAIIAKIFVSGKAKFYVILLKLGRVKVCLGKLTKVFQFGLGNSNSVPVLPRLPTRMSNPDTIRIEISVNFILWSQWVRGDIAKVVGVHLSI